MSTNASPDHHFMSQALRLARLGLYSTSPNPRVGCVIVKDGAVVGEGWHQQAGTPHAEVHALAMAGSDARGATCYVTLEPCSHFGRTPPCADALVRAGVARVVAAMVDPNPLVAGNGLKRLADAGIAVTRGVLEADARALNAGFIKRMTTGLPLVRVKLAASMDGRTAMASGESQWITGPAARADVQHWRAQHCAILSGANTVLADDPLLNVRWPAHEPYPLADVRQPVRVIVDGQSRISAQARLFSTPGPVWLVRGEAGEPAREQDRILPVGRGPAGKLDLRALLEQLGAAGLNEVWVEAGATLAGALIEAQLVDELVVYLAPRLLGHRGRALVELPGLEKLADSPHLTIRDSRMIGDDWRLVATMTPPAS